MSRLLPRQPAADLTVPTLSGTTWSLAAASPQRFSLIVFYHGLHCPICTTYVAELNKSVPEFTTRGVEAIAISSDIEARARGPNEMGIVAADDRSLTDDRDRAYVGTVYLGEKLKEHGVGNIP